MYDDDSLVWKVLEFVGMKIELRSDSKGSENMIP